MEDDAIAHGRRHDPRKAVCECAATLPDADRLEPEPMRVMLTAMLCMISVTGTLYVLLYHAREFGEAPCCWVLPLMALWLVWYLFWHVLQLAHRGRLLLFPDSLVFRPSHRNREVHIELGDIDRVGRRRGRIHIVLKNRAFYYFACSWLHGEDMYDQILAQLDELGLDVTSHERKR